MTVKYLRNITQVLIKSLLPFSVQILDLLFNDASNDSQLLTTSVQWKLVLT